MKQKGYFNLFTACIAGLCSFLFIFLGKNTFFPFIFFSYFAQLPFFLLAFYKKSEDVLIAGLVGTCFIFYFFPEPQLITYILLHLLPAVALSFLFFFYENKKIDLKQFQPEIFIAGFLAGFSIFTTFILCVLLNSLDVQAVWKKNLFGLLLTISSAPDTYLQNLLEGFLLYLPAVFSFSWIGMTLGNIFLSQFILKKIGQFPLTTLSFKNWVVTGWPYWFCAVSLFGFVFFDDFLKNFSQNLFCLSLLPFLIEGFLIFHWVYPKFIQETWGIYIFYSLVFFLGWPLFAVIGIGFLEPWLNIRQKFPPVNTR